MLEIGIDLNDSLITTADRVSEPCPHGSSNAEVHGHGDDDSACTPRDVDGSVGRSVVNNQRRQADVARTTNDLTYGGSFVVCGDNDKSR